MTSSDPVNVLLVDDQPAKLLSYEVILRELGENLVKTISAREAFEFLLKNDVAVVLIDVCMPELDGFQLAAMIRDHPRFQRTAIIFISAVHLTDVDRLRGYEMGGVDYVPVPVVPVTLPINPSVNALAGAALVMLTPLVPTISPVRAAKVIGCGLLICGTARLVIVPVTVPVTAGVWSGSIGTRRTTSPGKRHNCHPKRSEGPFLRPKGPSLRSG